jgi:16S rRNA (guanine527-N7)-methyltransferase
VDRSRVEQQIEHGLSALHLAAVPGLGPALGEYVALLAKWNETYNLTAVRVPEEMVTRHLMDCLVVLPFIGEDRVLDVGTGAGLPGIVLAMACPAQTFVVLDSARKKTRFVEHVVARLGLSNVAVVKARAEDYEDAEGFGVVLSRAFSSAADFIRIAGHLARGDGRLLAMKGVLREAELADLPADWRLDAVHKLSVPGLQGRRHLLEFRRKDVLA